jgi:hypothetical protein
LWPANDISGVGDKAELQAGKKATAATTTRVWSLSCLQTELGAWFTRKTSKNPVTPFHYTKMIQNDPKCSLKMFETHGTVLNGGMNIHHLPLGLETRVGEI